MAEKSDLEEMKKNYAKIQKKYSLPPFDELSRNFNIERIADRETDYLIREIRAFVSDRIAGYMRLVEMLLNPSNGPMFIFSMVKCLTADDKKKLTELYKEMARNEISLFEVDLNFSEEKEVKFLKESFKLWNRVKKDINPILNSISKKWDDDCKSESRAYFG
jgi:hypothetical protein